MESCNYFINKWWNTNCKHTVTHAHTFPISYISYLILDVYIYIYFFFICTYLYHIHHCSLYVSIFAYTSYYTCRCFFWAQCVRSFFMTLNSINPKMVWSSNHRCSIVVVSLRCGSLCLSTLASARLEYQFFTFRILWFKYIEFYNHVSMWEY